MTVIHVVQISFFLDSQQRTPAQILEDWWPLVIGAEMVAGNGSRVTVVQCCRQSARLEKNGVVYHFVSPGPGESTISRGGKFRDLIAALKADIFHVHGLGFPRDVSTLAEMSPETPILLQDHADGVPRFWRRRERRRGMSAAAGVAFCALDQAKPHVAARLIHPRTAIFEIPECSSRFLPGDQASARQLTGIHGNPAVLWVGHLDANKDPLTVLAGIRESLLRLPDLQLWCCFGASTLLPAIRAYLDREPLLAARVHLMGKLPHATIEQLMRAADMFVLGSHREGSGVSVIEALACGLPTVVTDIPSFRVITDGGNVGALWPCGDAHQFCRALISVAKQPRTPLRAAARSHFEAKLSIDAVGRRFNLAYQRLLPAP